MSFQPPSPTTPHTPQHLHALLQAGTSPLAHFLHQQRHTPAPPSTTVNLPAFMQGAAEAKPQAPLRLGCLSYLNALPILFEVEQGIAEGSQCLWGTPTQLNAAMKANELDITLVSSIEYLRHKEEWLLLENLSISSFAPVGSVVWIADRPCPSFTEALGAFEHFAVSSSSATSVALFQVLAHELAGRNLEPQLVSCNPHEPRQALAHHGNVLAIGDDALRLRHEGLRHSDQCFDLAELWAALTGGAPFVFGVWVARKSWAQANPNLLAQVQQHLQQQAQRVRTEPAWRQALQRHLQSQGHVGTALLETYWTEALNYELSPAHLQALDRFEALLQRHGLLHTLASPMAMAEG